MVDVSIWGIIFITLGVLILIKAFFGIDIPIFRIVLALALLYMGISLLINPPRSRVFISHSGTKHSQQAMFSKRNFKHEEIAENYQITFGQSTIDLRAANVDKPTTTDINISFGSATLRLNPEIPTLITANASFGKVEFPDDTQITMGNYTYRTHPHDTEPLLNIRANVSFGALEIESN